MGMPVVCSRIRGNVDLIEEGVGGYLFDSKDASTLVTALDRMMAKAEIDRRAMGAHNVAVMENFDKSHVNSCMREIYNRM